jgi:origin recognition complex subunit 3
MNKTRHRKLVSVSASDGSNLKALVKAIIRKATSRDEGVDEDDAAAESSKTKVNARLLNYDLQILTNHVKFDQIRQIAVTFQDTEAFDSDLLSDLIELLGYYTDRIPITFIFCLATSVEFLQQRLSRKAVKSLSGQLFDLAPLSTEVEQVFEAIIDDESPIWIGPSLISMLFERQNDYIQSIDTLVNEIQYAYMSAYYANALTMFLNIDIEIQEIPKDHFLAVRNLPSFRSWFIKKLNPDNGVQGLKDILEDNELLREVVYGQVEANRDAMIDITTAIQLIRDLQKIIPGMQVTSKSKLYIQAMSNKLNGSSLIRTLLLSIRKSPSNVTDQITDFITRAGLRSPFNYKLGQLKRQLWELFDAQPAGEQPLRSEDDVQNSTLRTTVVAQKVELSKQKSTLSKQDAAYTALLRKYTDLLEQYFKAVLIDPKSLLFHEVFIYDLKSPHREVFMPRPRHAIERALAAPHDYLDCNCCAPGKDDGDEQTLSASQPATAVLYQLYLESGSLTNASDLWQAFQAVVGDERTDEQNMALFQRALAEMKYLGMMKNTRKRVDHVQKCAWKGL